MHFVAANELRGVMRVLQQARLFVLLQLFVLLRPVVGVMAGMSFTRLIAAAAVTVSLLGAGDARAQAPWSAPATIASDISAFSWPALIFTGDGHALAILDGGGTGELTRVLAADPGASTFTEIGRTLLLAGPTAYGRRGVAYVRAPAPPRGQSIYDLRVTRLGVSLGTVPGSLGRFRQLVRIALGPGDESARIAADARGNVAAAWLESRHGHTILRVALRRRGHAFDRVTTLVGGPNVSDIALAYGANGDLVVAFERINPLAGEAKSVIAARVKRRGRQFGPIQSLGPSGGSSSIATAVSRTGRAVVAWGTQDGGEGVERPWTVRTTLLRSDADRFSEAQLLDPGRVARPVGPVSAAIGRDGTATVAWSGVAARKLPYPVRVATAGPTGRFGATAQLAPNGAARGVVTARDGTTTVLWGSLTDPEAETLDQIFASRRPAGARHFAAPEAVSPPEPAVNNAAIALDPRSGRPAALWIGAPGTPFGQPLEGDTPVKALYSTRGA